MAHTKQTARKKQGGKGGVAPNMETGHDAVHGYGSIEAQLARGREALVKTGLPIEYTAINPHMMIYSVALGSTWPLLLCSLSVPALPCCPYHI